MFIFGEKLSESKKKLKEIDKFLDRFSFWKFLKDVRPAIFIFVLIRGTILFLIGVFINITSSLLDLEELDEFSFYTLVTVDNIIIIIGVLTILTYLVHTKTPLWGRVALFFIFFGITLFLRALLLDTGISEEEYQPYDLGSLIAHYLTNAWNRPF